MLQIMLGTVKNGPVIPPVPGGYAMFAGGPNASSNKLVERIGFADDARSTGTSLTQTRSTGGGAAGNYTVIAIMGGSVGGSNALLTELYNVSTDLLTAGGNQSAIRTAVRVVGNLTRALMGSGIAPGGTKTTDTQLYTYSTNLVSAGGALSYVASSRTGFGNDLQAIFGSGVDGSSNPTTLSSRYTHSTDTAVAGASLVYANQYDTAGLGNQAAGYAVGALTKKYTYASNTVTAGTAMLSSRIGTSGASNATVGLVGGGNANQNNTTRYTFADDTVAASGVLTVGRNDICSGSSNPGGFPSA